MPGLDPGIQEAAQRERRIHLDRRVKPGFNPGAAMT